MSPIVFLLIAVLVSVAGSILLWFRHRQPQSMESGIDAFRREMNALSPPEGPRASRRRLKR